MDDRDPDQVLEILQAAEEQRPVGPGAGIGDIEVVAPGLGGVAALARGAGPPVVRDPVE